MQLKKFSGPGSTPARRRFWDEVADAVMASRKLKGKYVLCDEYQGSGTIISIPGDARGRGSGPPPPATGACCHTDHTCSIETAANCASIGGTYKGDGETCTENLCAACNADECGAVSHADLTGTVTGTFVAVSGDYNETSVFDCGFSFSKDFDAVKCPSDSVGGNTSGSDLCIHCTDSLGDDYTEGRAITLSATFIPTNVIVAVSIPAPFCTLGGSYTAFANVSIPITGCAAGDYGFEITAHYDFAMDGNFTGDIDVTGTFSLS